MIRFGRQQHFLIDEQSSIAAARRTCALLAERLEFSQTKIGELALVLTEAATNIIKHAGSGQLFINTVEYFDNTGVEIIAVDKGPGMHNIDFHLTDGNSTSGTYGLGLGSISRLSNEFDIYAGQGTALRLVVWKDSKNLPDAQWQCGAICLPIDGEEISGDDWCADSDGNTFTLALADGLGHGPDAAVAAQAATATVLENYRKSPSLLMQQANSALQGTRGAAVAIAQIDEEKNSISFCGIGNISVTLFNGDSRHHLVSHNGIVGTQLRKLQEFTQTWADGGMLIAHSDGLATRWDLSHYPGLIDAHPSLIAAILHRDFCRGRDDVTVFVMRHHNLHTQDIHEQVH